MNENNKTDYERNKKNYGEYWSSRFRRTYSYSLQTKLKRFRYILKKSGLINKKNLNVFDYGFGLGKMLFLFDKSCLLYGVELSEITVKQITSEANRLGYVSMDFRVYDKNKPILPVEWKEKFDIVIASHVLEHFANPKMVLYELVKTMSTNGYACLIVPVNELPGEDLNHFTNFTNSSFLELLSETELLPIKIELCDCIWDIISPLAMKRQRKDSGILHAISICINLFTSFLPFCALQLADVILKYFGFKERQMFVLCKHKSKKYD